jgi:Holliday junction resolvasome RuvABC endonuclease subunit
MIIYGIDPGQKLGLCIFDDQRSLSAMVPLLIKAPPGRGIPIEQKVYAISREIGLRMRQTRPDIVAIEAPLRQMPGGGKRKAKFMGEEEEVEGAGGGSAAMISSNQIVGGIIALCALKGLPYLTIPSGTWRKQFLGFGRNPALDRAGWKKAARERCAALRIAVTTDDAAEACGVAFAATATDTYRMMKHTQSQAREQAA